MNPAEFSEVANLVAGLGGPFPDGRGRTAVSRYYYAAFLEARDRLEVRGLHFMRKHDVHQCVQRAFAWADPKDLKKIGRLLEDLKKLREQADYDVAGGLDSANVSEAKRICSDVQASLATADLSPCKDPLGRT